MAFLFNPAAAPYVNYYLNPLKAAATTSGVELIAAPVHDPSVFEPVFAKIKRRFHHLSTAHVPDELAQTKASGIL